MLKTFTYLCCVKCPIRKWLFREIVPDIPVNRSIMRLSNVDLPAPFGPEVTDKVGDMLMNMGMI